MLYSVLIRASLQLLTLAAKRSIVVVQKLLLIVACGDQSFLIPKHTYKPIYTHSNVIYFNLYIIQELCTTYSMIYFIFLFLLYLDGMLICIICLCLISNTSLRPWDQH